MGLKNKKSLGQNWLKSRVILDKIATLAAGKEDNESAQQNAEKTGAEDKKQKNTDTAKVCLEIGPGLGTLTSSLLRCFDKVIAIEFDEKLAQNLPKSFPGKNLEVVHGDILKYDLATVKEKYVVAGNIPYYITSPIIEKILTAKNMPERVVLLVQKEVAERIVDEKETVLSLFVKNRARVWLGPVVSRVEFTPPPKVDSQVIVMEPKAPEVSEGVFDVIKIGFKAPRKKLIHNLSGLKSRSELEEIFSKLEISQDARPGDLNLADWARLEKYLYK